jgi:hypothetical protein
LLGDLGITEGESRVRFCVPGWTLDHGNSLQSVTTTLTSEQFDYVFKEYTKHLNIAGIAALKFGRRRIIKTFDLAPSLHAAS